MDISLSQYENIQRFLDGRMDEKERADFLIEAAANTSLKEALQLEQQIRQSPFLLTQHTDAETVRAMIAAAGQEWRQEKEETVKAIPLWKRNVFRYAAVIIAVIGVTALWFNLNNKKADYQGLFSAYFAKDTVPAERPPLIADLLEDYEKGEYGRLQRLEIRDIRGRGGNEETEVIVMLQYYKGVSFVATGDYVKAETELTQVFNTAKDKYLKEKSVWYLAMINIRTKNEVTARRYLQMLKENPESFKHQEATELLRKL